MTVLEFKHQTRNSSWINETVASSFFFLKSENRLTAVGDLRVYLLCLILQLSPNKPSTVIFTSLQTYMLYRSDINQCKTKLCKQKSTMQNNIESFNYAAGKTGNAAYFSL